MKREIRMLVHMSTKYAKLRTLVSKDPENATILWRQEKIENAKRVLCIYELCVFLLIRVSVTKLRKPTAVAAW